MTQEISGDDFIVKELVSEWTVDSTNTRENRVTLIASSPLGPEILTGPMTWKKATTVDIQMDTKVATDLYEKLGALGLKMGWLPQK